MKVQRIDNGFRITREREGEKLGDGQAELAVVEWANRQAKVNEDMAKVYATADRGTVRRDCEVQLAINRLDEAKQFVELAKIAERRDRSRHAEESGRSIRSAALADLPTVRSSVASGRVRGHAAVFHEPGNVGTEFQLGANYFERLDRGAFSRALAERHDTLLLLNHSRDSNLGRTPDLHLAVDHRGLLFEAALPRTHLAGDVGELIRIGALRGASFAFAATEVDIIKERGRNIRLIRDLLLSDVSVVARPAYTATDVGLQ